MASGVFSSFLKAFTGRLGEHRAEETRRVEHQMARDSRALELLATSDDPEIQNAAISGLAAMAYGKYEPKSGLAKFLGQAGGVNPDVVRVFDMIRQGASAPTLDVRWPAAPAAPSAPGPAPTVSQAQAAAVTGPTPAAMAPPPSTGTGPTPGQLPGPGGTAAPSIGQIAQQEGPPPAAFGQAATSIGRGTQTIPRQVFLRPEERVRRDTLARGRAQNEAEVEYLRTFMSDAEIKQYLLARTQRAAGLGTPQSVAGEINGQPTFGVFVPSLRSYVNPDTGEPLVGFRPRTTTGSVSMGASAERAAHRLFGKRYAALTPDQAVQADALASQLAAGTAAAQTSARMLAEASGPISADQRATLTRQYQADWRTIAAPYREMERAMALMEDGLARFNAGDKIGGGETIITTFKRVLDPTSVVREAEYDRTRESLGAYQRLTAWFDRLREGGPGVPPEELAELVETARTFLGSLRGFNQEDAERISRAARAAGLDPSLIVGGGAAGTVDLSGPPPTATTASPQGALGPAVPPGTRVSNVNGVLWAEIDGAYVEVVERNGQYYRVR